MGKFQKIVKAYKVYSYILNKNQKMLALVAVAVSIVGALLQTGSVAVLTPFLSLIMTSDISDTSLFTRAIKAVFRVSETKQLYIAMGITVAIVYVAKGLYSTFNTWFSVKFSNNIRREISNKILKAYLARKYDFFLSYGTAQAMRDINNDPATVCGMLQNILNIVIELLTVIMIMIYILVSDVLMATCILILSFICLVMLYRFFKNKMMYYGEVQRTTNAEYSKVLIQTIEGIKEVKVMRKQSFFEREYDKALIKSQKPSVGLQLATTCPTYFIESVFVSGIVLTICIRVALNPGNTSILPLLGSFAAGAIRMLPSLGRISSNVNSVVAGIPALYSLEGHLRDIEKEHVEENISEDNTKTVDFNEAVEFKNVCYHYEDSDKNVLDGLNMSIKKGESIGIIGASGAGKSTLADILLSLHIPQEGEVTVDGTDIYSIPEQWSRLIGYVPQTVYLLDGTIAENIAYGEDPSEIDMDRVKDSVRKAQLEDFLKTTKDGLDTVIGERGVRLSGGQRQRIAIARALYRNPQILIMDEATSALDNDTEKAVMEAIENLYGTITMVIIAHRITTVKKCDKVFEIRGGQAALRDKNSL